MFKTMITENERGLLFKNGRFVKMLAPGKYSTAFGRDIEVCSLEAPVESAFCSLPVLLKNTTIATETTAIKVGDQEVALHFVDGKFEEALATGHYAFWNAAGEHTFLVADTSTPEISPEIPAYILPKLGPAIRTKIVVAEYQKARLFYDNRFEKLLEPGTHYFWNGAAHVSYDLVDTRLMQLNITGQEILTQDKVALRINFVCNYKIVDFVKVYNEVDDFKEQLHVAAQLALREYVSRYRFDEILENKELLSNYVFEKLQEKSKALYVTVCDAGVKDIILPGEVRDIMNTVLIAEKRAQANVITRREEVASTRSLLNTAKLMDENQTLYRLKELEFLEKICSNVGNISLNGNDGVLTQLTALMNGTSAQK